MPNDIGEMFADLKKVALTGYGAWPPPLLFIGYKPFCVILLYEFRTMWSLQSIITMPIGAAILSLQRYGMFFRKALILSCFCVCCVIFAFVGKLSPVIFRALRTQRIPNYQIFKQIFLEKCKNAPPPEGSRAGLIINPQQRLQR